MTDPNTVPVDNMHDWPQHCTCWQANHGGVKGKLPNKSAAGGKEDSDDEHNEQQGEEEELDKSDTEDEVGSVAVRMRQVPF